MRIFDRIDINLLSILVIVVLFASSRNRGDRGLLERRLYSLLLLLASVELLADSLIFSFEGTASPAGRLALNALGAFYYIGLPIVPMYYCFYVEERVAVDSRRPGSWKVVFALPALASALVSLSSPWTGIYFYFDQGAAYHRGNLFPLVSALSYCYMLSAYFFIAKASRRRLIPKSTLTALLVFPLPPIVAGSLQVAWFEIQVLWPSAVLSLLVIFIETMNRKLASDYLTGAANRRRLDEYLEAKAREVLEDKGPLPRRSKGFAGFLVDLDDFKQINDSFGHEVGDEALILTVRLIRSCLRPDDFLARYAGDEFIAILGLFSEAELAQVVERLRSRFAESALPRAQDRRISFSVGAAVFDPALDADGDKYIARLDYLMYREKVAKKASRAKAPHGGPA